MGADKMGADKQTIVSSDTILDNLRAAVVCLDDKLRITYLNPASEMLFGVSARHCGADSVDRVLSYLADHRARLCAAIDEQDSQFYRVGGHDGANVDVRIIAATNQNLEVAVERDTSARTCITASTSIRRFIGWYAELVIWYTSFSRGAPCA